MTLEETTTYSITGLSKHEMDVIALALALHKYSGEIDQEVADRLYDEMSDEFHIWSK